MADVKTKINFVSFQIQEKQTIVNIEFSADPIEEGTLWDGGKRFKAFSADRSIVDIIQNEIAKYEFLYWERVG